MTDRPTDDDCVFCAIVAGDIPGRIVEETAEAIAFLDANPLAPGHTLVVPRGHYETVDAMPAASREGVLGLVGSLVAPVEASVDADASTIGINNGPAAGQEVPHAHAHIVPRFDGDGGGPIHAVAGDRPDLDDHELDAIADRIRGA